MKKSSQAQSIMTSRKKAPDIISIVGIVGIVVSMILAMIVLIMPSVGEPRRDASTVVFVGEYNYFPNNSMKNTLRAIGFNMEVSEGAPDVDDGPAIVVGVGGNSFEYVYAYKNNPSVIGFVLVCPTFPEGSKVNGMNASDPLQDIAIFAGEDNTKDVSSISDARLIYERLSGDDTVYGTPIKRGGLFASKCYVNNSQNRWLSLSSFKVTNPEQLLFSPLFQNELAGYLSTSYGNNKTASYARINAYYVLTLFSLMIALVSICIYLAGVPVKMDSIKIGSSGYVLSGLGLIVVASIMVVGTMIPRTRDAVLRIVPFSSVMIVVLAALTAVVIFVTGKATKVTGRSSRKDSKLDVLVRNIVCAVAPAILCIEYVLILGDMSTDRMAAIAVIAVLDAISLVVLAYVDLKYAYVSSILAVICAVVLMLVGSMAKEQLMVKYGMAALVSIVGANVVAFPSLRHGTNPVFTGITHGIAVLLLLVAFI
ncbi:MAG: hypothetical protein MJ093_00010 [Saccharofermentans sp.]|nr:hypothetical protein [Saccharofermentans sp.]